MNNTIIAGTLSSMTTSIVTYPIDYLKIRQMRLGERMNIRDISKYYSGFTIHIARVIPHFVIMIYITEYVSMRIKN
jgi:hypothetical protein